jgi:proteasome lid subunit RPN8/RPN11
MSILIKDNENIILKISNQLWHQMQSDLKSALPYEGCGLCSGINNEVKTWFFCKNETQSENEFLIAEQLPPIFREIRKRNERLLAIVHSHVYGDVKPSKKDIERSFYPEAVNIIISFKNVDKPETGAFVIKQSVVSAQLSVLSSTDH